MNPSFEILFDPKRRTQCGLMIHAWKGEDYIFPEDSQYAGIIVSVHNIFSSCIIKGEQYDFHWMYRDKPNFRTYIDFIKKARRAREKTLNELEN